MSEDPTLKKGVDAHFVECRPLPDDPLVIERRHRATCLLNLTARCPTCKNNKFTLFFEEREKRLECVQCPRWKDNASRVLGESPTSYVTTEVATCKEQPFEFCPSCPGKEELQEVEIDKNKEGWYSIWKRMKQLLAEEDRDG